MNKRISLGYAISLMILMSTVTFAMTMLYAMHTFNEKVFNIKEREAMYTKLAEIDRLVRENYYGSIDEGVLMDSIADGFVNGIKDKYSIYMDAEAYSKLKLSNEGKMVGIGVNAIKDSSGYIKVVEVFEDSPAKDASITKGDLIVKVDSLSVTEETYEAAISALKGEPGSKVSLGIIRGSEDIKTELTRRKIEIPTVSYRMIDDIGYISIKEFGDNTAEQFAQAIEKITLEGATAIIFDVRNNLGGTINSVVTMLDLLLPQGDIVSATYKDGQTRVLAVSDENEVALPMVVLTNSRTASAAELFAQALKDYNKAKTVGVTTYGKGSMQTVYQLSDGSALDITVALYNPPKSPNFEGVGVKPDFEVKLTDEQENNLLSMDEYSDPQIIKALEVARSAVVAGGFPTDSEKPVEVAGGI